MFDMNTPASRSWLVAGTAALLAALPPAQERPEHDASAARASRTANADATHRSSNTTAGRPTHAPHPALPPLFAWKYVRMGNDAFVAAKQQDPEHPAPKLLPRPAGAGRYVCAVVVCDDLDVEVAPLLGLRRQDVRVVRVPGPFVNQEIAAMLERVAVQHDLSLILLLSHQHCEALAPPADGAPRHDAIDERRALVQRLAERHRQDLHDAMLRRQRELLLAASKELSERRRKDDLRIVPGVVDARSGRIDWRQRRAQELPISPVK